jgi:hypothetical protein
MGGRGRSPPGTSRGCRVFFNLVSPIERPERNRAASNADEAPALWSMLDYYRATLLGKCAGLSDDDLRRRAVAPSGLSLLGILRHMSDVEVYWFSWVYAGTRVDPPFDSGNVGADFENVHECSGDEVAEIFERCVAESRELVDGAELGALSAEPRGSRGHVNLRYIAIHMIEEYARHCGHADLLREVIDGKTGD